MSRDDVIYSNARARALENTLLSQEKVTRLSFAENLEEGVKILFEANYGGSVAIDSPYEYEKLLAHESASAAAFLREVKIPYSGLECFLLENDYHNAKAFAKAKYLRLEDAAFMLAPSGYIQPSDLQDYLFGDNYASCPDEMQKALRDIDMRFATGERSSRFIDVTLDKALYSHIKRETETCREESVKKYFSANADFKNISSFMRCRQLDLPESFFKEGFVDGGEISEYDFVSVYGQPVDAAAENLKFKKTGRLAGTAAECIKKGESLAVFEAQCDNYLLKIFKEDRMDLFCIAPTAGFFVAKRTEIKVVRLILICLKTGADKSEVKKRLRELYA